MLQTVFVVPITKVAGTLSASVIFSFVDFATPFSFLSTFALKVPTSLDMMWLRGTPPVRLTKAVLKPELQSIVLLSTLIFLRVLISPCRLISLLIHSRLTESCFT